MWRVKSTSELPASVRGKVARMPASKRGQSKLEQKFESMLLAANVPRWHPEYPIVAGRRWRFDFSWPALKVAVELHGATFANGRHTRGSGFAKDREKMNAAQMLGWTVLEYTAQQVNAHAIAQVREALLVGPRR